MINEKYKVEIKLRIQDIEKDLWNNLVKKLNNPFYEWEWLLNLETSKSVSQKTGWQPLYLLLYQDKEENIVVAILFFETRFLMSQDLVAIPIHKKGCLIFLQDYSKHLFQHLEFLI